ncbi:hypothetical protein PENSPDRAFT_301685 [Peniophora sp. CONT]|nr:hypothetical protein PENSPDRAFT_301685 [Peniophora sp. CONT]
MELEWAWRAAKKTEPFTLTFVYIVLGHRLLPGIETVSNRAALRAGRTSVAIVLVAVLWQDSYQQHRQIWWLYSSFATSVYHVSSTSYMHVFVHSLFFLYNLICRLGSSSTSVVPEQMPTFVWWYSVPTRLIPE